MAQDEQPPREAPDAELASAAALAHWLDERFLDPLLGLLLPGIGDWLGAGLGLYTLRLARRRGAPRIVLARMLLNLALDALGGSIPLAGDLWDIWFRAHTRNVALLREHLRGGRVRASPRDWLVMAAALLACGAALAVPIALALWMLRALRT